MKKILLTLLLVTICSTLGLAEDLLLPQVPSDFDGDRRGDVAVFRPSNGTWYMFNP